MTTRTASLLMLFVAAFGVSAVLVAAIQPMAVRFDLSTPSLVPLVGIVCYSATLFLGRRQILPVEIANAATQALLTVVAVTTVSMALVGGLAWLVRTLIVGVPGVLVLALWFAALWLAVDALHRFGRQRRLPLM